MAKNTSLNNAAKAKKDEFYTRKEEIEDQLAHYADFFEGKRVYCNCDDPEESEFWQFFKRNFKPWKLKSLVATHYEPDEKNYAYKLELSEDTNGDGVIDWNDDPVITQIQCNGDFRNDICIELLKECDVVVTNPPFSLWKEYIAQLIEYDKKFIIIGSSSAITYKEIFPLLKDNKIWMGYDFPNGNAYFRIPDGYEDVYARNVYDPETKLVKFRNCSWYTNVDIQKRHEPIDLRGNYYNGNEDKYPKYDNYDAINVDRVSEIPCDYDGVMGVPITFIKDYCPEQFEIIGLAAGNIRGLAGIPSSTGKDGPYIDGKLKYGRILIKRR